MRTFKFRVWSTYFNSFFVSGDGGVGIYLNGHVFDDQTGMHDEKTELKLQQFTGLCDKNGKEIYEGDILYRKATDTYYHCEYSLTEGGYVLVFERDTDYFYLVQLAKECEIVGNIYQNPTMIKDMVSQKLQGVDI